MLLVESNNQHRRNGKVLVSSRGAVGRWQVRPIAARECRRLNGWPRRPSLDIYNERTNEMVGRWYLGYCWELSGKNLRLTFNYYNLGPTAGKKRYNYQHVNKILMIK